MAQDMSRIPTPFNTALLATTIVFVLLATAAVALRIYASSKTSGSTWRHVDNWLIVGSLVFCYGYMIQTICACGMTGVNYIRSGVNPVWANMIILKIFWTDFFLIIPASALVKVSILELYKRIFVTRQFRFACNVVIALVSAWCISAFFTQIGATTPVDASWNAYITKAHANYNYPIFAQAIFGIDLVLNVIILCMPIHSILQLQMSASKKAKIFSIFFLGAFCLVCSIVRFVYAHEQLTKVYADPGQEAVIGGATAMWGRMEPAASIIAACLPLYGPILPTGSGLGTMIRNAASAFSSRSSSTDHSAEMKNANGRSSGSLDRYGNWREQKDVEHGQGARHSGETLASQQANTGNHVTVTSDVRASRDRAGQF